MAKQLPIEPSECSVDIRILCLQQPAGPRPWSRQHGADSRQQTTTKRQARVRPSRTRCSHSYPCRRPLAPSPSWAATSPASAVGARLKICALSSRPTDFPLSYEKPSLSDSLRPASPKRLAAAWGSCATASARASGSRTKSSAPYRMAGTSISPCSSGGTKAGHSMMVVSWGSPSLRFCVRFLFVFARSNGSHATR